MPAFFTVCYYLDFDLCNGSSKPLAPEKGAMWDLDSYTNMYS